jgi:kynurenine formamidase
VRYSVVVRVRRIVDLSLVIDADTQIYPGDPRPDIRPATTVEADGYNVLHLSFGSHTATHVDAPYHFVAEGARLDDIGLSQFCGRAVIADVTGHAPRQPITWDDLAPVAERLDEPGVILVLRTGWSERHYRPNEYEEHPYLDPSACERILRAGVRTLAIDALNPDPTTPEASFPVHRLWLGAGGVIAENLTNLSAIEVADPLLCLFPIRLGADADGAPCRAVALEL